jgi:hypothetical protein
VFLHHQFGGGRNRVPKSYPKLVNLPRSLVLRRQIFGWGGQTGGVIDLKPKLLTGATTCLTKIDQFWKGLC